MSPLPGQTDIFGNENTSSGKLDRDIFEILNNNHGFSNAEVVKEVIRMRSPHLLEVDGFDEFMHWVEKIESINAIARKVRNQLDIPNVSNQAKQSSNF